MFESEFQNYLISQSMTLDYLNTISLWIRWCHQTDVDILVPNYTNIIDYVAHNVQAGISNGTINNRLKSIRKYYKFMVDTGRVPPGIVDEVSKFRLLPTDHKVKNVVDKTDFATIVGNLMDSTKRIHKAEKIRAILFFMFYTGPRIGEVVRLRRQDIDLEKSQVIFRTPTKNRFERYGYFPGGEKTGITHYLRQYFLTEPEVLNAFNMTDHQIRYLIEKVNKYLPEGKRITPHVLRHSFGNMLVEGNINPRVAQKLLGHININSTMIYYNPNRKTVERIYRENIQPVEVIKPVKNV